MATRLSHTPAKRSSVPLTAGDLASLDRLRADTPERAALESLAGISADSVTEAALLHALVGIALQRVDEVAQEAGYAELASQRDSDDAARRSSARRREPSWAHEA